MRQRIASSRFARFASTPIRARSALLHLGTEFLLISKWLIASKEHHNYTYDLSPQNLRHLGWWVSGVTGASITECYEWIAEISDDEDFKRHVTQAIKASDRRELADLQVRIARRAGWYALVRAIQPHHVVETGTDKGLGSIVIAAALLRNGHGRLTTVDINPTAGSLISGDYAEVIDLVIGDSLAEINSLSKGVDLFIHDADHSTDHESLEIKRIEPHLNPHALILSDNAHATNVLVDWAELTGRSFSYFQEQPIDHWYPGAGIGAAWQPRK